jgi:predicted transcriptional regulator
MSTDDSSDGEDAGVEPAEEGPGQDVRERLEREADQVVERFDEGVVDLLSWLLDTETRARLFVYLRQQPDSTSDEVAEGTGLYPSTVREALAELHEDGLVIRQKRESDGAGNNPYEYAAIPPSELVGNAVEDVQDQLNAVCNLDRYLDDVRDTGTDTEPVTITVENADED